MAISSPNVVPAANQGTSNALQATQQLANFGEYLANQRRQDQSVMLQLVDMYHTNPDNLIKLAQESGDLLTGLLTRNSRMTNDEAGQMVASIAQGQLSPMAEMARAASSYLELGGISGAAPPEDRGGQPGPAGSTASRVGGMVKPQTTTAQAERTVSVPDRTPKGAGGFAPGEPQKPSGYVRSAGGQDPLANPYAEYAPVQTRPPDMRNQGYRLNSQQRAVLGWPEGPKSQQGLETGAPPVVQQATTNVGGTLQLKTANLFSDAKATEAARAAVQTGDFGTFNKYMPKVGQPGFAEAMGKVGTNDPLMYERLRQEAIFQGINGGEGSTLSDPNVSDNWWWSDVIQTTDDFQYINTQVNQKGTDPITAINALAAKKEQMSPGEIAKQQVDDAKTIVDNAARDGSLPGAGSLPEGVTLNKGQIGEYARRYNAAFGEAPKKLDYSKVSGEKILQNIRKQQHWNSYMEYIMAPKTEEERLGRAQKTGEWYAGVLERAGGIGRVMDTVAASQADIAKAQVMADILSQDRQMAQWQAEMGMKKDQFQQSLDLQYAQLYLKGQADSAAAKAKASGDPKDFLTAWKYSSDQIDAYFKAHGNEDYSPNDIAKEYEKNPMFRQMWQAYQSAVGGFWRVSGVPVEVVKNPVEIGWLRKREVNLPAISGLAGSSWPEDAKSTTPESTKAAAQFLSARPNYQALVGPRQ